MAASKKRRIAEGKENENSDYANSDSDDMNVDNAVDMEEVQVDFEATTPNESDFHGIKRLLQQLFLKAHVNLSELTDFLIQQNFVSSVIKQSEPEDISEDDSEEDESFGVTSVINITAKRDVECVKQIRALLLAHCKSTCSVKDYEEFKYILEDPEKHVGLILSERFLNIPPQISLPLYESLSNDMKKAREEKKQFDFAYYLLICKIYTEKGGTINSATEYANAEEEFFAEEADITFDYSVSGEQDTGLGGKWMDDDEEWQRHRRILLLSSIKWDILMEKLRAELSTN